MSPEEQNWPLLLSCLVPIPAVGIVGALIMGSEDGIVVGHDGLVSRDTHALRITRRNALQLIRGEGGNEELLFLLE